MRKILVSVILYGALVWPVSAQEGDGTAIRTTIQNQMEAFRAEDAEAAFAFASPMIKGYFGTPERFGQMVRGGYPMIWAPSTVEYLGLRREQGRLLQRVLVRDAENAIFLFDYDMVATPDGWQINGVYPVAEGGAGA
jgi:hypothetical protein